MRTPIMQPPKSVETETKMAVPFWLLAAAPADASADAEPGDDGAVSAASAPRPQMFAATRPAELDLAQPLARRVLAVDDVEKRSQWLQSMVWRVCGGAGIVAGAPAR